MLLPGLYQHCQLLGHCHIHHNMGSSQAPAEVSWEGLIISTSWRQKLRLRKVLWEALLPLSWICRIRGKALEGHILRCAHTVPCSLGASQTFRRWPCFRLQQLAYWHREMLMIETTKQTVLTILTSLFTDECSAWSHKLSSGLRAHTAS